MAYGDFQALEQYISKLAGAAVTVKLVNESDPSDAVIGAASNLQWRDNFEQVPIEEAGSEGVDEHATGRHDGSGSLSAFFTPAWSDALPSREDFIGKSFLLMTKMGDEREGAGTTLNAFVGLKITGVSSNHGARGAKTLDISFVYQTRYKGKDWADLTGTA